MTDRFWSGVGLAPFSMADELRRVMGDFMADEALPSQAGLDRMPALSVTDEGDRFTVRGDLPGVTEGELEVTCHESTVTVRARREVPVPEGWSSRRRERASFALDRSFRLPVAIDAERAAATLRDGTLELVLPKAAQAQPRRLTVRTAADDN